MAVRAVVFDIGETLIDETEYWSAWADFLGVPRFTFFAALGACIAQGLHHREVFPFLGFDYKTVLAKREKAGGVRLYTPQDFYPDAVLCLQDLKDKGFLIGLAGNQPEQTETMLNAQNLPVDFVASSARWGVKKPSPEFFLRIVTELQNTDPSIAAHNIAYVGDRLDFDVLPALAAGMVAVFLKRGPWGVLHAHKPEATRASVQIENLHGLAELLLKF